MQLNDRATHAREDAPPIALEGVSVVLGGQRVLDDVSLTIEAGDFVGLVGPNGSGKTTLLRTMLGLQQSSEGTVRLYGQRAARFHGRERIGYVPQHAVHVDARFPASALEVVLLGRVGRRGLLRRLTKHDRAAALAAMRDVGVEHLASRPIGAMSGGQRQRVFLAKALCSEPEVLVLDEPTTGIDPGAREEFYNLVDSLNHERGLTILFVSHDVPALEMTAHRLVVLNQRVLFDGSPERFAAEGGYSAVNQMHIHHGGDDCDHPV